MVVEELLRQGKSIEDARAGGTSGCVETGAFGKEAYILTGYFNLPKVLEIALNNGADPRTGKQIGIETGDPRAFQTYEELFAAFRKQLQLFHRHQDPRQQRHRAAVRAPHAGAVPSLLIDDCIAKGGDYNDGGPRYNTTYIMGVAPGTCTDSLAAIKYHVFDQQDAHHGRACWRRLRANFEGHEKTRLLLWNKTPKYGNDDDYADAILAQVFDAFFDAINGRPNTKGGDVPRELSLHHLPRLLRLGDRRHAGRPQGLGAALRRHLAGAGRRPPRPHGGDQIGRANGPRPHRRHAAQPEVHAPSSWKARRARPPRAPGPLLLQAGRPPHPVQRGDGRDPARGAGASRDSTAT